MKIFMYAENAHKLMLKKKIFTGFKKMVMSKIQIQNICQKMVMRSRADATKTLVKNNATKKTNVVQKIMFFF